MVVIISIEWNYIIFLYNDNTKLILRKGDLTAMMLCGVVESERIIVHPDNKPHESHWIEVAKDKDRPVFYVTYCCNNDWSWDFWYNKTNYDIVKHLVMDCIFDSTTMDELINELDNVFTECCSEIVFYDNDTCEHAREFECDGDCDNCEFN